MIFFSVLNLLLFNLELPLFLVVTMPRRTPPVRQDQEGEMIDLDGSDLGDGSGQEEEEGRHDEERITAILQQPLPDADIPTLRKVYMISILGWLP